MKQRGQSRVEGRAAVDAAADLRPRVTFGARRPPSYPDVPTFAAATAGAKVPRPACPEAP